MDPKHPTEKEVAEVIDRRASVMTVENPLSPSTTLSDSNSVISVETRYSRYSRDDSDNAISHQLSRTSTNAIGGVTAYVPPLEKTVTTGTTGTQDLACEVDFEEGDKTNPQNWSLLFRGCVIAIFSYATTCVVLYSTSYTSAIPGMLEEFGVSENTGILGVTTYLLGMATGAVVLAPLSEM